jgi:formylglycine-generating enzyme required for sulfatase activity
MMQYNLFRKRLIILFVCLSFFVGCGGGSSSSSSATALVNIETTPIGNSNNMADPDTGFGAVNYEFAIGKYLVTVGQYVVFLNAVATVTNNQAIIDLWNEDMQSPLSYVSKGFISRTGLGTSDNPYIYQEILDMSLSGNSSLRAVPNINWFAAARFANWINNGATKGADTESGAYTLNYATEGVFVKNADAKWWIPSEDEWYKSAYYDPTLNSGFGGYYKFPTKSNAQVEKSIPTNNANSANYDGVMPDAQKITPVGAYAYSQSYYGTFDQGGLLWQWNDAVYKDHDGTPLNRGMRGGSWSLGLINISKYAPRDYPPTYYDDDSGFRLASTKQ